MGADHARILASAVSNAAVVAVSEPDAARVAKILEVCTEARAIADPLELIRAENVDAVLIASPDSTHGKFVHACLDVAKPVLCEKPLAGSVEECLDIVRREEKLDRRLVTVGYMRRFDPGYVEMKRKLRQGELGAALVMHCIHRNVSSNPSTTGAMLIANSAVHEFDIARFVLGSE
ncbi:MAG: inositol 2-dehydrogenase, partial [Proteobacteria bacterium]